MPHDEHSVKIIENGIRELVIDQHFPEPIPREGPGRILKLNIKIQDVTKVGNINKNIRLNIHAISRDIFEVPDLANVYGSRIFESIIKSQGIILLIDPKDTNKNEFFLLCLKFFSRMMSLYSLENGFEQIPIPVAVCFSKMDTNDNFVNDPDNFNIENMANELLGESFFQLISNYFRMYKVFGISSIGWNANGKRNYFINQDGHHSPTGDIQPINVFEMIEWLINSIGPNAKPSADIDQLEIIERMRKYIIGQDAALSIIAKGIRNSIISKNPRKGPIGKFMLVGPTGVGKTETAKALAYALTGDSKDFIFFSANEYPGEEAVGSAFGPKPGYRGYQDEMQQTGGGILTKPLIANPKKRLIILIDEIEKTSETFRNALFALLDEGMTDDRSAQRKVSFKNCIIISTSNFADRKIAAYMATKPDIRNAQAEVKKILIYSGMPSPFLSCWTLIPYTYPPVEALKEILIKNIRSWISVEQKKIETIADAYLDSLLQKNIGLPTGIRGIIDEARFDLFDQLLDCKPGISYVINEKGKIVATS